VPRIPASRPGFIPGRSSIRAVETAPAITAITPNSGRISGGATLTITGRNFRRLGEGTQPTVSIGGFLATSVTVVSSTQLTCVVPVSTLVGLVDVVVTIQGQAATLVGGFTFYTTTITSIDPGYGPIAGGTLVTIKGHNFLVGSSVLFDGVTATGIVYIDDETIVCNTPNHALGYVDVSVVEP
jgi:hypothetical protein